MQINNKKQQHLPHKVEEDKDNETKRDVELENTAGNLMIAQYQVDKLRYRISQKVRGVGYRSFSSEETSAHTFEQDGKWYKVSIKVEEISMNNSSATKSCHID